MQDTRSALDEVEEHEPIQSVDENTLGESPKNTTRQPVVDRLITVHPALKYLGFSFLMAYHYLMWFCPSSFFKTDLLAASVTVAWLWNLVGTAFFMIVTVVFLGRKRHLSDYPWVMRIVTVLLIVATALLLYGAPITSSTYVIYIFSFVAGGLEGLMWILWGESLTRARANFSVVHIGTTFGATVLVVMVVSLFIPADFSPLFVMLLAALSGVFLYAHKKIPTTYPVLLPRDTVKPAFSSVLAVCSVGCFTGVACYYLVAIVPWEHFSVGEYIFEIGVVTGAALILLVSGLSVLFKAKASMFKLFPYYLVFAPALAVTFSVASIRIGIALGNCLGLFYERHVDIAQLAVTPTTLLFICILAFVLVPVGKLEPRFIALTTAPVAPSQIDMICSQIIAEFKLSEREGQILKLIARGNTVNSIANKLVISPHTVNTHIRHIYDKVGIHKRGELLEYINMKKEEQV